MKKNNLSAPIDRGFFICNNRHIKSRGEAE